MVTTLSHMRGFHMQHLTQSFCILCVWKLRSKEVYIICRQEPGPKLRVSDFCFLFLLLHSGYSSLLLHELPTIQVARGDGMRGWLSSRVSLPPLIGCL